MFSIFNTIPALRAFYFKMFPNKAKKQIIPPLVNFSFKFDGGKLTLALFTGC